MSDSQAEYTKKAKDVESEEVDTVVKMDDSTSDVKIVIVVIGADRKLSDFRWLREGK